MAKLCRTGLGAGILATALFAASAPVFAFELFGVRLWGSDEDDDGVIEVIDPLPYSVTIRVDGADDGLQGVVESPNRRRVRHNHQRHKAGLGLGRFVLEYGGNRDVVIPEDARDLR